MAEYTVVANTLDHIIAEAGTYPDSGRPKKVAQHHKGDVVDLGDVDEERLEELERVGAIVKGKVAVEDLPPTLDQIAGAESLRAQPAGETAPVESTQEAAPAPAPKKA